MRWGAFNERLPRARLSRGPFKAVHRSCRHAWATAVIRKNRRDYSSNSFRVAARRRAADCGVSGSFGDVLLLQMSVAVLPGLSAPVRSEVFHEGSACRFREALRLNRLPTQANEVDARFS